MSEKLSLEDREEAARIAVERMPKEHIELWKKKLENEYRSFDAYCNSCSKIWEMTCRISTLALVMKKNPILGPPTLLSPKGSVVCTCKDCLERYD